MVALKFFQRNAPRAAHALVPAAFAPADLAVYAYIFAIGAFQFTHYLHTADYVYDASYPDMARSLLETGSYQLRFLPQTTLPPGFALILALVGLPFGLSPGVLLPVVAVSATLGFIAAYELLRRVEGRAVAAGACLLLASSPTLFGFVTLFVYPEMTYLLLSMLGLLLAIKVDRAGPDRAPIGSILLLSLVVSLAVLVRSVGVALLGGMAAWIAVSLRLAPEIARRRMGRMLTPLVLGLCTQFCWSLWAQHNQVLEWQLPGYPQSYVSQLRVKDGHNPELGLAHLGDIPERVWRNIIMRAAGFVHFLARRYVSMFWSSPAIFGVLLLVAWGLASSLWHGAQLYDWYFFFYESIYLVWPWDYSDRFLFPVFPLTCLYLWRGIKELTTGAARKPRAVGLCLVLLGFILSLCSAAFAAGWLTFTADPQHPRGDLLQPVAATVFWLLVAAIGFVMFKTESLHQSPDRLLERFSRLVEAGVAPLLRLAAVTAVGGLMVTGTAQAIVIGRRNLTPDLTQLSGYPMIEAAEWIRIHEPPDSVAMARDVDFIFHYTRGRVVWFPPISDPKVLMDGIRRYKVGVILVVHHAENYWLPAEDTCFRALQETYRNSFRLVHRGIGSWVYEVISPPTGS
jgi:hypothetical protein